MSRAGKRVSPEVAGLPSLEPLPPLSGHDPRGREEGSGRTTCQDPSHVQGTGWEPTQRGHLQEGLGMGQGSGRARDVVRGQDGHDDGRNMMRAPSRQLSAPMNKGLKAEGGCAWPRPPALGFPGQKLF